MSIARHASHHAREPARSRMPPPFIAVDGPRRDAAALTASRLRDKAAPHRPSAACCLPVDAEDEALRAKLTRVVAHACPSWAAAQQEDIVQAAMLRVLRARARREHGESLPDAYLWKTAYCATIDELRRIRAKREVPLASESRPDLPDVRALGPERDTHAAEISTAIQECLATLNEARRQAVTLHLQGHSVPETGRLLGWSTKRAENMVYRGLAELREHLAKKGLTP